LNWRRGQERQFLHDRGDPIRDDDGRLSAWMTGGVQRLRPRSAGVTG